MRYLIYLCITLLFYLASPFIFVQSIFAAEDEEPNRSCVVQDGYAKVDVSLIDSDDEPLRNYLWRIYNIPEETDASEEILVGSGVSNDAGKIELNNLNPWTDGMDYELRVYDTYGEEVGNYSFNIKCGETYKTDMHISELDFIIKYYNGTDTMLYKLFDVFKETEAGSNDYELYMSNASTGNKGKAKLFVSPGVYMIRIPFNKDDMKIDGFFYMKDIVVAKSGITEETYTLSRYLQIEIKYESPEDPPWVDDDDYVAPETENYVANKAIQVYQNSYDAAGNVVLGTKLYDGYLSTEYPIMITYPGMNYTIKLTDPDGVATYIKDIQIADDDEDYNEITKAWERSFNLGQLELKTMKDGMEIHTGYNVYMEETDMYGNKVLGEKIASNLSSGIGRGRLYAPGKYIIEIPNLHAYGSAYYIYNITVSANSETTKNFSGFVQGTQVSIRNADNAYVPGITYEVYKQINNDILGEKILTYTTTEAEDDPIFYTEDPYVVLIKGQANKKFEFWNQYNNGTEISNPNDTTEQIYQKVYVLELIRIFIMDENNKAIEGEEILLSTAQKKNDGSDDFYPVEALSIHKSNSNGQIDLFIPAGQYQITYKDEKYFINLADDTKEELFITYNPADIKLNVPKEISITEPDSVIDLQLAYHLSGRLLLQVNQGGRIWYVSPHNHQRYEVTFANALALFEQLAVGISNENLNKIKSDFEFIAAEKDSDNDGYSDLEEVKAGYNPFGNGIIVYDQNIANRMKGRLLLQVEDKGRIWYVDRDEGLKYEVTWENLMDLFTTLSLGITDENLYKIPLGNL